MLFSQYTSQVPMRNPHMMYLNSVHSLMWKRYCFSLPTDAKYGIVMLALKSPATGYHLWGNAEWNPGLSLYGISYVLTEISWCYICNVFLLTAYNLILLYVMPFKTLVLFADRRLSNLGFEEFPNCSLMKMLCRTAGCLLGLFHINSV